MDWLMTLEAFQPGVGWKAPNPRGWLGWLLKSWHLSTNNFNQFQSISGVNCVILVHSSALRIRVRVVRVRVV
jgi:hypothetical protein